MLGFSQERKKKNIYITTLNFFIILLGWVGIQFFLQNEFQIPT